LIPGELLLHLLQQTEHLTRSVTFQLGSSY
jgi:hypothetical protein